MFNFLKSIYKFFKNFGFDFYTFFLSIRGIPSYIMDLTATLKQKNLCKDFPISKIVPMLADRYDNAGVAKGHYFHQDLLIAQKIFENNPVKHVDIGSRIDGFVAHVASYRQIEIMDIRELKLEIQNISFCQADLMNFSNEKYFNYADSVSCLHALEHFGLGRYGDPIDVEGHVKGFTNITKVLKQGGTLYFSTPIGKNQRIEFNAHRVFSLSYLIEKLIKPAFDIISFSYVDDDGKLIKRVNLNELDHSNSFNLRYGCGIFELRKL